MDLDMYAEELIYNYENPKNKGRIGNATAHMHEENVSCGDTITVYLSLEGGKVHVFPGNYEDFLWRKEGGAAELAAATAAAEAAATPAIKAPAEISQTESAPAPAKRVNPIKLKQMQDRLKFVEEEIPRVEALIGDAEQSLGVFVSVEETARVTSELDGLRGQHGALTAEWEELMELVEEAVG